MNETDGAVTLRRTRILMMLVAAEHAGLTPMAIVELHEFAYFANVLSPVWELLPQTRAVLHRAGGPYYTELQKDVDALVGRGIVGIEELHHVRDHLGRWRLGGKFFISAPEAATIVIDAARKFTDECDLFDFYRELAFALNVLSTLERQSAYKEDATYGAQVGEEVIIDFAQWRQANYSENAARFFDYVMPDGRPATAAQKLHLYTHHLKRRLADAR
jgi:hypothetical protein